MQMQTLKFVKKEVPAWTTGTVATPRERSTVFHPSGRAPTIGA